uniref:Uncharacterized protein n=1 Tax=Sinocyclocheilus anshuiensis TaxID=1608454 RepID=A0A671MJU5_9TELE
VINGQHHFKLKEMHFLINNTSPAGLLMSLVQSCASVLPPPPHHHHHLKQAKRFNCSDEEMCISCLSVPSSNVFQIPNFLHLTPVAIKKHCAQDPDHPVSAYCLTIHYSSCILNRDAVLMNQTLSLIKKRFLSLQVKLSSLNLDDHARKKMLKLSEERYCKDTDTLTTTTDRCVIRIYQEKTCADMEEYEWEDVLEALLRMRPLGARAEVEEGTREQLLGQEYRDTVLRLKNDGETEENLQKYKEAVKKLFNI